MFNKVVTSAPGKLILSGEHSVVYGKEALACSLNLRTECSIQALRESCELSLEIPSVHLTATFKIEEIAQHVCQSDVEPVFSSTCASLFSEFLNHFEDKLKQTALHIVLFLFSGIALQSAMQKKVGVSICITTDLPVACGLGSSAALAVAIASGLLVYCNIISDKGWNEEDYKLINKWAFLCEKIVHGNPSGVDNSVSTYGNCISFKSGVISRAHCESGLNVLIINTKVTRNTKDIVASVRERSEKLPKVYLSLFEAIEQVTLAFKSLLILNDEESHKYVDLEHLVDINQHLLEAIGVSHPVINEVIDRCKKYGLHSKLTGAGGGGCVYSMLINTPQSTVDALVNDLQEFDWWVTKLGGEGVQLLLAK